MEKLKFILTRLIALFAIIYLASISYIYFNQEEMIFLPKKLPKNFIFKFDKPFEEVNIPSFDGVKLNGLLFKSINPKGIIFYLHGNAGSLDTWGSISKNYTKLGYDIFILDYRGFGKSNGNITSEIQFNNDITTAYKFIKSKHNENKIIIVGYSIGTGPATILASKFRPKALVLQAPYFNLKELSDSKVPFVPDFIKKYKFETNLFITKVKSPIFIFHGTKDKLIPFDNSVRLNKLFKSNRLFTLLDEDHIGLNENEQFLAELKNILK